MICIDASLIIRAFTKEAGQEQATKLFDRWVEQEEIFAAPTLLNYEICSALSRKVFLKEMEKEEAISAYHLFRDLGVRTYYDPKWDEKALLLSMSFNQRTIYDFVYLVCAEELEIDLYTADHRFVKLIEGSYSFVKYFGG